MCKILTVWSMVLVAVVAWAQTQVATVTSSAPFTLRGATVTPGAGVPTWPVLAADDITAGTALIIVTFPDGSVITMAPASEAKVDLVNGQPTFQLLSGSAKYSRKSKKSVVLLTASGATVAVGLSGTLAAGGAAVAAFWTTGVIAAVVVGTAAAVGTAVGVAHLVQGGADVSPSR